MLSLGRKSKRAYASDVTSHGDYYGNQWPGRQKERRSCWATLYESTERIVAEEERIVKVNHWRKPNNQNMDMTGLDVSCTKTAEDY